MMPLTLTLLMLVGLASNATGAALHVLLQLRAPQDHEPVTDLAYSTGVGQ